MHVATAFLNVLTEPGSNIFSIYCSRIDPVNVFFFMQSLQVQLGKAYFSFGGSLSIRGCCAVIPVVVCVLQIHIFHSTDITGILEFVRIFTSRLNWMLTAGIIATFSLFLKERIRHPPKSVSQVRRWSDELFVCPCIRILCIFLSLQKLYPSTLARCHKKGERERDRRS